MLAVYDTAEQSQLKAALDDIYGVATHWRSWVTLGWHDILHKYRGSVLGPFWITLSMAIFIGGLSAVYGGIFGNNNSHYITYLAISLPLWGLMSESLQQGCTCFSGETLIKQIRLPYSVFVARVLWRNTIIFLHNIVIFVVVSLFIESSHRPHLVLLVIGYALFVINLFLIALLFGVICARFRDFAQIVTNLIGLVFFISPVMWEPKLLEGKPYLIELNVFNHMMEVVRQPILGEIPKTLDYVVSVSLAILGCGLCLTVFMKFRRRLAYWI